MHPLPRPQMALIRGSCDLHMVKLQGPDLILLDLQQPLLLLTATCSWGCLLPLGSRTWQLLAVPSSWDPSSPSVPQVGVSLGSALASLSDQHSALGELIHPAKVQNTTRLLTASTGTSLPRPRPWTPDLCIPPHSAPPPGFLTGI